MNHEEPLVELLFDRLAADAVPDDTAEVVLAALSGSDDLAAALAGEPATLDSRRPAGPAPRAHLASVAVAGFRGVGPERTLPIRPGPGLTLVVGRNGSGKSSLAEAVELALTAADGRLLAAARPLDARIRAAHLQRGQLCANLTTVDDDRARRAAALLTAARPDLDRLSAILAEPIDPSCDTTIERCRRLAAFTLPDRAEVARLADQLRAAVTEAARHDGSRARSALRTAELLRLTLEQHDGSDDSDCPVCGVGKLNAAWRKDAVGALTELRDQTLAAGRATARLTELLRQARNLIDELNPPEVDVPGMPLAALQAALAALRAAPGPDALAEHLAIRYPQVADAADAAREYAANWLRERDSGWQQAAAEVRSWVDAARRVPEHESTLNRIRRARTWLKTVGAEIRTFPPRAAAVESPLRFIVVDDPVRNMDPSKVDEVARILAELAADRQIVVLTHGSRLLDAMRRLEIDVALVEVVRAEQSVVTPEAGRVRR